MGQVSRCFPRTIRTFTCLLDDELQDVQGQLQESQRVFGALEGSDFLGCFLGAPGRSPTRLALGWTGDNGWGVHGGDHVSFRSVEQSHAQPAGDAASKEREFDVDDVLGLGGSR